MPLETNRGMDQLAVSSSAASFALHTHSPPDGQRCGSRQTARCESASIAGCVCGHLGVTMRVTVLVHKRLGWVGLSQSHFLAGTHWVQ